MNSPSANLFPSSLRQAVMEFFATNTFGAALLREQPKVPPGREWPPATPLDRELEKLLHPREAARAESYRLEKRRHEFLLGRASAKMALAEYWAAKGCHPALPEVEIVNDSSGRPVVNLANLPDTPSLPAAEISITHGGGFAAALAAADPCGIDLQEQKDTLLRVLDKYCSGDEERRLLAGLPELEPRVRLSLLWTAKEAAKKACSSCWMPGFLDLRLMPPVRSRSGCHVLTLALAKVPPHCGLPLEIAVLATTCDGYGLAVCMLERGPRHARTAGS